MDKPRPFTWWLIGNRWPPLPNAAARAPSRVLSTADPISDATHGLNGDDDGVGVSGVSGVASRVGASASVVSEALVWAWAPRSRMTSGGTSQTATAPAWHAPAWFIRLSLNKNEVGRYCV